MTLDEAIQHLEESLNDANHDWSCEACKNEHVQLLEWLKELKAYKETKTHWIARDVDCRGYTDHFECAHCGRYIYTPTLEKYLDYNCCPYCHTSVEEDDFGDCPAISCDECPKNNYCGPEA